MKYAPTPGVSVRMKRLVVPSSKRCCTPSIHSSTNPTESDPDHFTCIWMSCHWPRLIGPLQMSLMSISAPGPEKRWACSTMLSPSAKKASGGEPSAFACHWEMTCQAFVRGKSDASMVLHAYQRSSPSDSPVPRWTSARSP